MMALYEMGQVQEAGQLFEQLNRQGQDPAGTLSRWASLLVRDKEWTTLGDLFMQKGMQSPDLLPMISEFCLQIGIKEDPRGRETAQECLAYLVANHPNHPGLYLSLGRLHHYWEQYKSAEQMYRKILSFDALVEDSVQAIAMNNLAWILANEFNNLMEALQLANKGLAIQPENADLLDTRGEIFYKMGEYEKAREDLEKSLRLYPAQSARRAPSGYRLIKTLAKLGKNKDALEMYKQVEQWNQQYQALTNDQIMDLNTIIKGL